MEYIGQRDATIRRFLKREMLCALKRRACFVTQACADVGITSCTFYRWQKEDPEFARRVREIREEILDRVEEALFRQIEKGNADCIVFYLERKGQSRGYALSNNKKTLAKQKRK